MERARKHKADLAHKRSFFVRMVSDPKLYNPGINKSPPTGALTPDAGTSSPDSPSPTQTPNTP